MRSGPLLLAGKRIEVLLVVVGSAVGDILSIFNKALDLLLNIHGL